MGILKSIVVPTVDNVFFPGLGPYFAVSRVTSVRVTSLRLSSFMTPLSMQSCVSSLQYSGIEILSTSVVGVVEILETEPSPREMGENGDIGPIYVGEEEVPGLIWQGREGLTSVGACRVNDSHMKLQFSQRYCNFIGAYDSLRCV